MTLRQWSVRFLDYLGAPPDRAGDARVAFLERWATLEGTFRVGNRYNPLDTEMPAPGARLWNRAGVRRYRSLGQGFRAILATMRLRVNRPILKALHQRGASMAVLALALAESDWTGHGPRSWVEQGYASRVSGQPLSSFGLPEPTMSITGVVVDAFRHPVGGACITAIPFRAAAHVVETGTNGSFDLSRLPRTRYRLEVAGCHPAAGAPTPAFYAGVGPNFRTADPRRATAVGRACSEVASCPSVHVRLGHAIEIGRVTPPVAWRPPAPITFGTRLTAAQLDATSPARGTFRYEPPLGAQLAGGVHELRAVFEPANTGAFTTAVIERAISVHAAAPRLSWSAPAPIPPLVPLSVRELDAEALQPGSAAAVPGTMEYSVPRGTVLAPGRHVIWVTFVPADPGDYSVARGAVVLTVRPVVAARSSSSTAAPVSATTTTTIPATTTTTTTTTLPAGTTTAAVAGAAEGTPGGGPLTAPTSTSQPLPS